MCFVKNFRVGQFSGPTRGSQTTLFPLGRHPARIGLNSPLSINAKEPPVCSVKNFRVGQFLRNTRGLPPHFHRTMEFKPI